MTNMNFTLSSSLQTLLNSYTNPYIYALEYTGGIFTGAVNTIASPGNIPTGQVSISLPASFASGQVYVLVQPNGDGTLGTTISTMNNGNNNAITPATAQQYGFTYQLLEATLSGSTGDLGDISSVNTFAFPATLSADSNGARGFAPNITGSQISTALNTIAPGSVTNGFSVGPAQGSSLATNPWPSTDWTNYVNALQNGSAAATAALADMQIVTYFGPGPTFSQYTVSYANGYFVFTPVTTNGGNNTDYIRISTSNLLSSIYAQTGVIEISTDGGNTYNPTTTFTPNTADGTVAKYFVAGFDAGYWGGSGTSPNPGDPSIIDLNKTWNWNYNYAYDATFNPSGATGIVYSNTLGSGPGTAGGGNRFYDPWAQTIQNISNTYGWSYGDLISQGGTNPQISLWNSSTNAQVSNIDVTLYSTTETLTSSAGFIAPPLAYVAPPAPTTGNTWQNGLPSYFAVNTPTAGQNVLSFATSFGPGNMFSPNATTPLTLKFYAPSDSMADATGFVSLPITSVTGSDWAVLQVNGSPGAWTLTSIGAAPPSGDFTIYNLPVTSNGSTGWYQIVFGDTGHQTTYNIYATSNGSGAFLPISGAGSSPSNFVVDHGLGYGPGQGVSQNATGLFGYSLNFAPSGSITYDVATFSAPSTTFGTMEPNVLNGTGGNDTFNASGANDIVNGGPGTDTAVSWYAAKNFTVRVTANNPTFVSQAKVGTDGTDSLTSVERLQFRDQALDMTWMTKTAGLPVDQLMKVVDLYTAGLNRAPDALGLDYYASRLADGVSIGEISKAIFSAPEAAPIFSPANANTAFVSLMYQTALGRAADAAGAAYWLNELNTGHIQRSDFVTAFVAGTRGPGGGAADVAYVASKETVGAHFALTQGLNNAGWASTVLSGVNGTAASVTAANAQTDGFAATAATAAGTELVVQIVGLVP